MDRVLRWLRTHGILVLAGIVLLSGIIGAIVWLKAPATPPYKTAKVEKGTVVASVAASGTLSPVVSVQVGSQISGQILELFADFNTEVKRGQIIARIDPETFEYKVRQAQADLDTARAQVAMQRAEAERYRANAANAKRDFERSEQLYQKGFISVSARDTAHTNYTALAEQAKSAKAQVIAAESTIQQKTAILAQAKIDLERTAIRAPVNGVVIKRSVDKGQTVAASLQAPELFIIAENLTDMEVDTSVDESEIGRIRDGQKATFTVDAFPNRTFEGTVKRIRKSSQTVSNVVTYLVEIATTNPGKELLPGMTANVRIVTDTHEAVLRVPNAALRFRPTGVGKTTETTGPSAESHDAEQLNAFRERLDKELSPSDEQKAQLDTLFTAAREKLSATRKAQESDRKKNRHQARSDLHDHIAAILTPEQKTKFDALVAESAERRTTAGFTAARIYLLDSNGNPKALSVRAGITDGTMTEIFSPELKEGMDVIVGTPLSAGNNKPAATPTGPRMF